MGVRSGSDAAIDNPKKKELKSGMPNSFRAGESRENTPDLLFSDLHRQVNGVNKNSKTGARCKPAGGGNVGTGGGVMQPRSDG